MATFRYKASTASGEVRKGILQAISEAAAKNQLWEQELNILSIQRDQSVSQIVVTKRHKRVNLTDLVNLFQRMATLVNAGVPILRTLSMLAEQTESNDLQKVMLSIQESVSSGLPLYAALQKHPSVFKPTWINMIQSGEISGQFSMVLGYLALHLEEQRRIRMKIITTMTYPIILISFTFLTVVLLMYKVVPTFETFYKDMGAGLPKLTQIVLGISHRMQIIMPMGLLLAAVGYFLLWRFKKTDYGAWKIDLFRYRVPLLGNLFLAATLERFTSNLTVLVKSGTPLLASLDSLAGLFSDSPIYRKAVIFVRDQVTEGAPLAQSLEQTGCFPLMVTSMVEVGEETGRLSDTLEKTSLHYQQEVENLSARLVTSLEPIMIIGIAIVIGVILLSLYLPIFKMATAGMKG